ncbi:hypothetical protein [Streptomyces sp. NPDC086010]|uniref:hypothetical protein n=1 Tax=Streptomyces sp. NPDC086010 TaxID=3365745 RepID=UPI0037D07A7E
MTVVADTSTSALERLAFSLRWAGPPSITPAIAETIFDAVEAALGDGDVVADQDVAHAVAHLRLTLDFLILEALTWDPSTAATVIERAEDLADRDTPGDVDDARGLLRLMALAAMDLLEQLAPVPPDHRVPSLPPPVGATGHGFPDHRRGTSDVQSHAPLPARHGSRRRSRQGRHRR